MPSCCEVSRAVAGGALEEASARRRLALGLHLLMCRHCRRYARQIRAIGLAARDLFARPPGEEESLKRLREALEDRADPPSTPGTRDA